METIRKWYLNTKWVRNHVAEDREELYRKAFKDARSDLDETFVEDVEKRAGELMEKRLNEMLSVVDDKHVVTLDKARGMVYIGGVKADELTLQNLKAEADFITESTIWKLIHNTPKELAMRSIFVSSESLDDLRKGKSMLYVLSSQENIVNTFKGYNRK